MTAIITMDITMTDTMLTGMVREDTMASIFIHLMIITPGAHGKAIGRAITERDIIKAVEFIITVNRKGSL
jgi:hypothetical protein